jgi:hypothetical protein
LTTNGTNGGPGAAYEALLADIATGVSLHYDSDPAHPDPDLALLQGDQRYAQGLSRLAELGDVAATTELADVISLVAQAYTAGDPDLAQAVWEAGVNAVLHGGSDRLQAAKNLARAGNPNAAAELRAASVSAKRLPR